MTNLSQKFRVTIDLDSTCDGFNIQVENLSVRKGYVDIEHLKSRLLDAMQFMIDEGIDSLVENVASNQLH